jgi:succinyl-CoA synthetase alpha subunit
MSIMLDEHARVMIFGITGKFGRFAVTDLRAAGTRVVAGVSPAHAGTEFHGIPVYGSALEGVQHHGANAALVYVPAPAALDAVVEAIESGCSLVAYPGDGLPLLDAIEMRSVAQRHGAWLVGPNSPGIISPGRAKLGVMPTKCYRPGSVGMISRSGSLSYEVAYRLSSAGIGQSTAIGIGGDPVKGTTAGEAIRLFDADPQTTSIVYLGEIGGFDEQMIAEYAQIPGGKPVAALVVGRTAPAGKKMGHAAAMIASHSDTWQSKIDLLTQAGIRVAHALPDLIDAVSAIAYGGQKAC